MTEVTQARDLITNMVTASWNSSYPLEYQDRILNPTPDSKTAWGRVNIKHEPFNIASFADGTGKKRFDRFGTLTVQVFTPPNDGLTLSDAICADLQLAFEGKTDPTGVIWYRDVYAREVGLSGGHYQVNFITSFSYSHIK